MAHQRCFVCGQTNGDEIVQVTCLLEAHKNCFCGYQCRTVLNTGREEASPARNKQWLYNWRSDMGKYVSPECANIVESIFAQNDMNFRDEPTIVKLELYKELKAAAKSGMAAFGKLAMIC